VHNLLQLTGWAVGILAALHALLWKRDPRAALGWICVCLLVPWLGALAYALLGVNRLKTQAQKLGEDRPTGASGAPGAAADPTGVVELPPELAPLAHLGQRVTGLPLVAGNGVQPLHDGEQAYPAMLDAIGRATRTVWLCTYIFDTDSSGRDFIDALAAAATRGLDVRVIVDGIGERYSRPRAAKLLEERGVKVARFLPPRLLRLNLHINLRNHRKLLLLDGELAFTGGMNIGDRHLAGRLDNPQRVIDLQFRVEGPVLAQMEQIFLEDWAFATGTAVTPPPARRLPSVGPAACRSVTDGPDEDLDRLNWILHGAFAAARRRLVIMTPYFIPDRPLIAALVAVALRGVRVDIVLPGLNNLPYCHWATRHLLWELLAHGVRVWYQPPPFVHSKLLLVDDAYTLLGSANIDSRSLRLNFEFGLEVIDRGLNAELTAHVDRCLAASRPVTQDEVDGRPILVRVRDGLARLASPYL
jgi:cardiolipin synthase